MDRETSPVWLNVNGRSFARCESEDGLRYHGQFNEYVEGSVVLQSGRWQPVVREHNPFRKENTSVTGIPAAESPEAALRNVFAYAAAVDRRYQLVRSRHASVKAARATETSQSDRRWQLVALGTLILMAIAWTILY